MLRSLLLAAFTIGAATLTFALMGLASIVSVACRSRDSLRRHDPSGPLKPWHLISRSLRAGATPGASLERGGFPRAK